MLLNSKHEVDILGVLVALWALLGPQVSLYWCSCIESCESIPDWSCQVCLYTHPYVFASVFSSEQRSLVFHHAIVMLSWCQFYLEGGEIRSLA